MLSRVVLALALAAGADASAPKIAGYAPGSNVIPHNRIDLSAQAIMDLFKKKNVHSSVTDDQVRAVAYDMYNNGAGKSSNYLTYKTSTTSTAMSNSAKTFTCKQTKNAAGATADLMIGKLAHKSAVSTASGTSLKVYMDSMESVKCGNVPFKDATETLAAAIKTDGTGSYGDSKTEWDADPWSASKGIYRQASCPTFGANGDHTYSGTVVCSSSVPTPETITYTVSGTPKYGSRSLKGFSTAVEAKMIDGPAIPEFEALSVKAYHGIGSYGDIHIQAAFAALKTGITNNQASGYSSFSSCTDCANGVASPTAAQIAPCLKDAVTDKAACTASDVGGTWSQGTALCKNTKTNHNYVNLGAGTAKAGVASTTGTFTADLNKCGTGRKVTDYQLWSGATEDVLLIEIIQKMAVYTNAWLYAVHEFEDAIADCVGSDIANNDAGVHAWDEGVAFYTGTLAGEENLQNGGSDGAMLYALANKRCKNYKTCIGGTSDPGQSQVNLDLFPLFTEGMLACNVGDCSKARTTLDKIIPKMSVPLIQGTLRYAYKVAVLNGGPKEFGEGTAFMMSVIHRVGACSKADARIIYDALDVPSSIPSGYALGGGLAAGIAGFTKVKEAFERNYACMGVTCADIGSLQDSTTIYFQGCTDPAAPVTTVTVEKDKEVLPDWALAAIGIAGVLMLIFFGMMCSFKAQKDKSIKMFNELNAKNGGKV